MTIPVVVTLDDAGNLLNAKVGSDPPFVFPRDQPMPRRFVQVLTEAAIAVDAAGTTTKNA